MAVTLANMSLKNGKTLFKGKADISVTVYDIHNGTIAFRKSMPEFEFPKMDGPSIVDTTESQVSCELPDDRQRTHRRAVLSSRSQRLGRARSDLDETVIFAKDHDVELCFFVL